MNSNKAVFPLAVSAAPGIGGVSARFSILPEKFVEQTEALGEALVHLIEAPAAERAEAAEVFTHGLEDVAGSAGWLYREANNTALTIHAAMTETVRKTAEETMRFFQDLAHAKEPSGVLGVQFRFFDAQARLLIEQSQVLQTEFARHFLPCAAQSEDRT